MLLDWFVIVLHIMLIGLFHTRGALVNRHNRSALGKQSPFKSRVQSLKWSAPPEKIIAPRTSYGINQLINLYCVIFSSFFFAVFGTHTTYFSSSFFALRKLAVAKANIWTIFIQVCHQVCHQVRAM